MPPPSALGDHFYNLTFPNFALLPILNNYFQLDVHTFKIVVWLYQSKTHHCHLANSHQILLPSWHELYSQVSLFLRWSLSRNESHRKILIVGYDNAITKKHLSLPLAVKNYTSQKLYFWSSEQSRCLVNTTQPKFMTHRERNIHALFLLLSRISAVCCQAPTDCCSLLFPCLSGPLKPGSL